MFGTLIKHQWKEKVRSPFWQKSLWINILLGIFILYLILNLLFLGYFIDRFMEQLFPGIDTVIKFTQILFYYFLADLLARFFLQELPAIEIQPYRVLPIKRKTIINYILFRSGFSLFNLLPLIVFIPFVIKVIIPGYSGLFGIFWILTVFLLMLCNNFLIFFLKKYLMIKPLPVMLVLALVALIFFIDYRDVFPASTYFEKAILFICHHQFLIIIPLGILFLSIFFCSNMLKQGLPESKRRSLKASQRFGFLNKYGELGRIIQLEIKMIWRNNRPKTLLMMSVFFLLYGFMFYPKHIDSGGYGFYIFIGIMMTGIFMIQYGQFALAWESSYFDLLLTKNITKRQIFNSKAWFFSFTNLISFLLTLPYSFFDSKIALVNLSLFLFNSGINVFIILLFATYNTKRIDAGKGAFFNYEGLSASHYLMVFPVVGLPLLLYLPFALTGYGWIGIVAIGVSGLAGLICRSGLLNLMLLQFDKRKYKLAEGFRKK